MQAAIKMKKLGLETIIRYLHKDPDQNLRRLIKWADQFGSGMYVTQRQAIRRAIENPDDPYYPFIRRLLNDVDEAVLDTIVVNFFVNANLVEGKIRQKLWAQYNCNIPWAILLDPTSACNLRCKGCWATEYGRALNLSFDEINDIIRQGKELGVYLYIYTGGEPLVRKQDLLRLCQKHSDCVFLAFTNGTLIDEAFAEEMLRVKNFVPAISLEGDERATDARRGEGVYQKVIAAMALLKKKRLLYGISSCYTSENFDAVTSAAYFDQLIDLGAYFVWYFHYMPVGNDASVELLPTPEQRREIYRRIRTHRAEKPLFAMDFQNDAEFVGGCIAGGRQYLHINPHGDIEPCVFIHYSDSNIREKTLLEALQSPLFMAYYRGQPFNENMLLPCPMLENPDKLRQMVAASGAASTDLISPESVDHLCAKCDAYAQRWKPVAETLFKQKS